MAGLITLAALVGKLGRRSPLGDREREALLSLPHRVADLDRQKFIAREGERMSHCALLMSGHAYCHKVTGDGARQILSIHLAGDLLDPQNGASPVATCNVQPLGNAQVALIPRDALVAVAAEHPGIAAALWADTGANASILSEWLLNVGRRSARSRIAHLVCELAVRQQWAGLSAGLRYPWVITQEQLGDATGLTSVHVNRTLQGLRRDRLVHTAQRQISVLDWAGLCRTADFSSAYLQLGDADAAVANRGAVN